MIAILFEVVAPAFIVVAAGVVLGRSFAIDMSALNRVALYAAVPALVFSSLSTTDVSFADVGLLVGANALFLVGMGVAAWLLATPFARSTRRGLVATSMFGNAANIMLPVTLFAFGPEGLERALVLYVFSAVALFTLGPIVLGERQGASRRRFLASVLRLPVLWAALAGAAVNALDWGVPLSLARGVELLGSAAIPVVLVSLGLQVQRTGLRMPSAANVLGTGLKLALGPLVGFATAYLVGARGLDLAVLTLLAAMPPAVNTFMLALEFGADGEEVARTVILSTVTAIASLTIVLSLLQALVV